MGVPDDIFAIPSTLYAGRPSPDAAAVMSSPPLDDVAAAATAYPTVDNVKRQHSMVHREFSQYASPSPSRPHRPNAVPWLKHDHAIASEPSQHHHGRNFRRVDVANLQSDPIRPSSSTREDGELTFDALELPDFSRSPRWDSLSKGTLPLAPNSSHRGANQHGHYRASQRIRAESSPTPRAAPRSAFPGLCSNPYIPGSAEAGESGSELRQFPLLGRYDEVQRQPLGSPSSPLHVVDSSIELRQPASIDGNMTVENFSRPRKPSVRSQNTENPWSRQLAINRLHPEPSTDQPIANQTHTNYNTSPSPWSRTRGLSTSSSRSTSTFSSVQHRPSNDHLSATSRTGSLRRANPPPTSTSSSMPRPPLAHANSSAQPLGREIQPWLTGGDEIRSSFRSQLTSSTAQGTLFTASGTERSSVMTKTSSITEHSIINGYARASWISTSTPDDGPSLEDVMGMYERGFNDSDIESIRRSMRFADADEDDDIHEFNIATGGLGMDTSRPPSSHSDMSKMGARMLEAMNDQLPVPGALAVPMSNRPATRDSKNNFRKSLLASSLPKDIGLGFAAEYMAKRFQVDVTELGKHDSANMLDGDGAEPERFEASQPTSPTIPVNPLSAAYVGTGMPPSRSATPAPAAQYPVEPPEDPSSRDRYGFRKANANVSREEYDTWDASYNEYLSRRRKKWVAFLKDNSLMTDNPNRFPPRSAKTKRFIRKGIPPEWRGAAWFYYAGGPAILSKHRGVYEDLLRRAALDLKGPGNRANHISEVKPLVIEDIEKDLHRTFPDNVRFRPPPPATSEAAGDDGQAPVDHSASSYGAPFDRATEPEVISSLRRVLHAFALYNPRIGYCQSLNFLAGLLLLFVETEEQAFWLLNVITRVYLPGTHEMSLEGSKVDLGVLMLTLKDSLPAVWKQIGGDELEPQGKSRSRSRRGGKESGNRPGQPGANDPNRLPAITLCMTAWFMSCFIGTLPMETVLRVWDVFFYEGSRTLFRIALTIFKLAESEIKAVTDPMEMFGVVQTFPRRLVDSNALMEACYRRRNGIGHLSQEDVEEKRQERRNGIRRWRVEQEAAAEGTRSKPVTATATATAGLDLAADLEAIEVRRKGTLFGRRKDREQVRAAEVM